MDGEIFYNLKRRKSGNNDETDWNRQSDHVYVYLWGVFTQRAIYGFAEPVNTISSANG
jgi:hypothetical protein